VVDTPLSPDDGRDPDYELLGLNQLLDEGIDADLARAVLDPHNAVTRREARERLAMLRRDQEGRP
jgi:hypothetical protein